jgi:hypothetical protein
MNNNTLKKIIFIFLFHILYNFVGFINLIIIKILTPVKGGGGEEVEKNL